MSEKYDEAMFELRELCLEFRARAECVSYGYFLGGDPRKFSPDPECSTPEEQTAHREACKRWDDADQPEPPMPQCGNSHVGYGVGTTAFEDPMMLDAAECLQRIIDRLEERD